MTTISIDTARAPTATVAEALGQIVWLFDQSPLHREVKVKDLSASVAPALLSGQFRIFRFGPTPAFAQSDPSEFLKLGMSRDELEQLPLGVALWAFLSEEAEGRLEAGERLSVQDWTSGDRLWLVEMISPFATPENKLSEVMLLDLINGPFQGLPFSLHRTDAMTGERKKVRVGETA